MGPVKGYRKKRKIEKIQNFERDLTSGSSEDGFVDWWAKFSKRIVGNLSPSKDLDMFESVIKISRKTFNYLCSLVMKPMAKSRNFSFMDGTRMSLNDRVAIAIRRLRSGESLVSIGELFGLNRSTVSQITWCFVECLEETGLHHLQWPCTEKEMADIKAKFMNIEGLPNCCGAIDITHVMMSSTSNEEHDIWTDRTSNSSMVLQAIVDPEMKFRDVVAGWPGKMTDSSVLCSSTFFELCEKGNRLNGNKIKFSDGTELREYIVGDSGFPLLPWLVTPYQDTEVSESKANFNKRHFKTWIVAQKALAKLKQDWKIIQGVMWRPDKHKLPRTILACCILHNIGIDMNGEALDESAPFDDHDSGYDQEVCQSVDATASVLRDSLSLYLDGRLHAPVNLTSDE